MQAKITHIEISHETIKGKACINCLWRDGTVIGCNSTPIPVFRIADVLESLARKGFKTANVVYSSKFYGYTLSFDVRKAES